MYTILRDKLHKQKQLTYTVRAETKKKVDENDIK